MPNLATRQRPGHETAPAALHAIGADHMLAVWDAPAGEADQRLRPSVNGAEAPRPYALLSVPTSWGGRRTLAVLRRIAPAGIPTVVRVAGAETGVPVAEARAGGALPDVDPRLLFGTLDAPARLRVVRMILDFAGPSAALRTDPAFVETCRRLVSELAPRPSDLVPCARMTDTLLLCEGTLSRGFGEILATFVLTPTAMGPAPLPPQSGEGAAADGRRPLHLALDRRLCADGTLVVMIGRNGLATRTPTTPDAGLPALADHFARTGGNSPARRYAARSLAARGANDPSAAAALLELQALSPLATRRIAYPARPLGAAVEVAVPVEGGGLFLAGWLHDPHGLATGIEVVTPFGDTTPVGLPADRFARTDVAGLYGRSSRPGFVAFVPGAVPGGRALQVTLALRLASGGTVELVPPPRPAADAAARDLILAAMPAAALTDDGVDRILLPAVAPLQAAHQRNRRAPDVVVFGSRTRPVDLCVVVALADAPDRLRMLAAALATDPGAATAELLVALDGPDRREEAERLLRGLHRLYGLPVTLVAGQDRHGRAAATNDAVAAAGARRLLLLGADVLPMGPGWIGAMADALADDPGNGADGARLLHADGSVAHAGLVIGDGADGAPAMVWRHRGWPADHPAALAAAPVAAVTEHATMTTRAAFEAAGGLGEAHLASDRGETGFCLRLAAAGLGCRFVPRAALLQLAPPTDPAAPAAAHDRRLDARMLASAPTALHPSPR
ncbi:MAG: glycosyltransferase family 2 protein [Rhodospirillales bacterium]